VYRRTAHALSYTITRGVGNENPEISLCSTEKIFLAVKKIADGVTSDGWLRARQSYGCDILYSTFHQHKVATWKPYESCVEATFLPHGHGIDRYGHCMEERGTFRY
jgi:hypothetical protein